MLYEVITSTRSKDLRDLTKSFKARVKKTRKTIQLLKDMPSDSVAGEPADVEAIHLLKAAIDERLKTDSDRVSRRLMQLRLENKVV